ncbi:MAG TPA: AraC family transcriptional regulator [Luteibacter sp.]|jgi:AraC-like DNA-binding protein|nr:AraC family transcriptional regulator [Luteibacter sp.]
MTENTGLAGISDPGACVDDPRYTAADIPPNILAGLTLYANDNGIDCAPWFAGLSLDPAQIADPNSRVSYRQASIVIRRAMQSIGDPALGMRCGREGNLGSFGLLGLAMMTSRTFGDAMRVGIEHHRICGSLVDIAFEMAGPREAALVVWPRFGERALLPFLCEELFASSLAVARELVGPRLRPLRVELTYPQPAYAQHYADFFQCELRFGAPVNRIVLDASWLDEPLPGHNARTTQQALALCMQQLPPAGTAHGEIVAAVERQLRRNLREHPRLPDVARTLNLSERSLRRKLAESGRVFREIHDRVRAERALELLHAGRLSVADIGNELGFSDPREFRRAFKRWTGMPPRDARRAA